MVTKTEFVRYPYRKYSYTLGGYADQVLEDIRRTDSFASGFDTTVSTPNPLWRYQIAKRVNASKPYSRNVTEFDIPVARCETFTKGVGSQPNTRGFDTMRWAGIIPSSFSQYYTNSGCDDRALARLKRKLGSHTKDFNLLIPAAELRELRSLISGAAALTTGFVEALLSIRKTKGKSAYKFASEAWLTYGFGIAPLVADTKNICEAIEGYLLRGDHSSVLSGTDSISWSSGGNLVSFSTGAYGSKFVCHSVIQHELSYQYKGGFNFALTSANDYGALDHFHVKLPALVPTAWELMPFSWVMDYFTTVGAFLDDVFSGVPVNTIYLNRTRKYKATGINYISYRADKGTIITSQRPACVKWSYSYFDRTPLANIPRAQLRVRSVDEVAKYSLNKLLNLTAILGMGRTNLVPNKPWRR